MDRTLAAKMFHALVVMGASLGGACGPTPPETADDSSGGTPPQTTGTTGTTGTPGTGDPVTTTAPGDTTTDPPPPATTTAPATTTTDDGATTTPVTSSSTATTTDATTTDTTSGSGECAHLQQKQCQFDENFEPFDCFCDPNAPLSADDCPLPSQFFCQEWNPLQGCFCDPDAPNAPEDCASPNNFNCHQYGPVPTTCRCECSYGPPTPQNQQDCTEIGPFFCEFEPFGCCCHIQLG